jgi:hypothetical protein
VKKGITFSFFSVFHHLLWIVHCPWPSSQFNKWHARNLWLSSSLIGSIYIGSASPWFTPPSHQRPVVAARLVYISNCEVIHYWKRPYFYCRNLLSESVTGNPAWWQTTFLLINREDITYVSKSLRHNHSP